MAIGLNGDATLTFDHLQPYNPFQLFIWFQTSDRGADFRVQLQPSVDLVTLNVACYCISGKLVTFMELNAMHRPMSKVAYIRNLL